MPECSDLPENSKRLLVALYRLSKGRPGVVIAKADLLSEVTREGLFRLSEEGYAAYKSKVCTEVERYRATELS